MSLEQPEEDLRFIFPVLSFIRVWDKGSTSHIYNEPLSLLSVLSQISDIVRWWAEQSLVRDGRQISDDDNDDDDDTAPDPGHDMPLTIDQSTPSVALPLLSNITTAYYLDRGPRVLSVSREMSSGRAPGCPRCPAPCWPPLMCVTPGQLWAPQLTDPSPGSLLKGTCHQTVKYSGLRALLTCPRSDKKALIKAIKMNGRPLSTRSDIVEHHLAIRIIDCCESVWAIAMSTWWLMAASFLSAEYWMSQ